MRSSISEKKAASSSSTITNYNAFTSPKPTHLPLMPFNKNKTTSSNTVFFITNPKKRKRPPMSFMSNRNVKRRIDDQNNDSRSETNQTMSKSRKQMKKIKNKNKNKYKNKNTSNSDVEIIEKLCNHKSKSKPKPKSLSTHRKRIKIVNKNRTKTKTNKNTQRCAPNKIKNTIKNAPNSPSPPPKPPAPPAPPKPIINNINREIEMEIEREHSSNNINIPIMSDNTCDERKILTVEWDNSQQIGLGSNLMKIIDNGQYRYSLNQDILCWHEQILYNAKVCQRRIGTINNDKQIKQYLIHYHGWNNAFDEWVCQDKILANTPQNIELVNNNNKKNNKWTKKSGESTRKKLIKSKEVSKKQKNININPFGSPSSLSMSSSISSLPKVNIFNVNGANGSNNMLQRQLTDLQNKYNMLQEKYREKCQKCVEYKDVARKLYSECVSGESPRWHLIEFRDMEQRVRRDAELAQLRSQIGSLYPKGSFEVTAVDKWKGRTDLEKCVLNFVKLNGEYKINAFTMIDNKVFGLSLILEKFLIKTHDRITDLNGQYGVRAKKAIPKNTCVGQYFGAEILQSAFGKVYDGTGEECDHNIYAFDQKIDPQELIKLKEKQKRMDMEKKNRLKLNNHNNNNNNNGRKRKKKQNYMECDSDSDCNMVDNDIDNKVFIIDPFIGDWKNDELILRFVNDCRGHINDEKPSKEDNKYYNVEYVGMKVNGWPQTYLVTKRDIKNGEELMTYYGKEFNNAIRMKMEVDKKKRLRKQRIDKDILKHLKYDIISTQ